MTGDEIDEAIVLWRILLRAVIDRIEVIFFHFRSNYVKLSNYLFQVGYEKDLANRSLSTDAPPSDFKRAPKLSGEFFKKRYFFE